jgi:hypothetical protein
MGKLPIYYQNANSEIRNYQIGVVVRLYNCSRIGQDHFRTNPFQFIINHKSAWRIILLTSLNEPERMFLFAALNVFLFTYSWFI